MTILRDGKTMGTYEISDLDEREISRLMVGRDVSLDIEKEEMEFGKTVFSVRCMSLKSYHSMRFSKNTTPTDNKLNNTSQIHLLS